MKKILLISLALVIFISCSKEPVPIHFGEDGCSYCRMIISDQRFGGELFTAKGKVYKFDSIECMAAYVIKEKKGSENIQSLWTVDFDKPGSLIDAATASYLLSDNLKSPMGANLSSYENREALQISENRYKGHILSWVEVKDVVKQEWLK